MKLNDLIKFYLESQKFILKRRTYLYYLELSRIYIEDSIGLIGADNLTTELLNEFVRDRYINECDENLSYSTIKVIKSLINRSLEFGLKHSYVRQKVKIDIILKKKDIKKVKALSRLEQEKIESYILENKRYYSYGVLLSLYTGLRIGELLSLRWENVDLKNNFIVVKETICKISNDHKIIEIVDVPKTSSSLREIPISSVVKKLLRELKSYQNGNSEYVVARKNGNKVDMRTYQDSFSRLLKRINVKHYGFHSLRHTFASRCLEMRIDIKTISELLGHANPTITLNRYVHTSIENKRNALNIITKQVALKCWKRIDIFIAFK